MGSLRSRLSFSCTNDKEGKFFFSDLIFSILFRYEAQLLLSLHGRLMVG